MDTDVAIGSPFRDPDDAYALVLAARSPSLRIERISTTYGNASLKTASVAAHNLVQLIQPRVVSVVSRGAHSRDDLGRETSATRALADALEKNRLTYVALGPLTNLATFQLRHPQLARRIDRVIFLGGASSNANFRLGKHHHVRVHDANVVKDPEAVRVILQSKIPITLVPIETASQLMITARDLDAIGRSSAAGRHLQQKSKLWLWFWTKFLGTEGAPVFDAGAILAAAAPHHLVLVKRYALMDQRQQLVIRTTPTPGVREIEFAVALRKGARANMIEALLRGD
jgi:pyrimidine-specific ribonucleoside hydrolase